MNVFEEAAAQTGGVTAVLLLFGGARCDAQLEKQVALLHHFFGPGVWARVVFAFQSQCCTRGATTHAAAIVRRALQSLSAKLGVEVGAHITTPVLLAAHDSPDVVLGKAAPLARRLGRPARNARVHSLH